MEGPAVQYLDLSGVVSLYEVYLWLSDVSYPDSKGAEESLASAESDRRNLSLLDFDYSSIEAVGSFRARRW